MLTCAGRAHARPQHTMRLLRDVHLLPAEEKVITGSLGTFCTKDPCMGLSFALASPAPAIFV